MQYDKIPPLSTWIADTGSRSRANAMVPRAPIPRVALPRTSGLFKEIDALIELYHKAFQPMSKRNVLFDLESALAKPLPNLSPQESEAVKALKDVVKKELASLPKSAGKYERVLCIGWNVGCNYSTPVGARNGYFRHSGQDQTDMEQKCAEMFQAISQAEAIVERGHLDSKRRSTLKIFMAPEFYFRGVNGAYSPEIVSQIIPKLQQLGTDSSKYEHWLFIFGTAVAAIEIEQTICETCDSARKPFSIKFVPNPTDKTKTIPVCSNSSDTPRIGSHRPHKIGTKTWGAEIQNVALVQKGKETALVAKEYISSIDYKNDSVKIHPGTSNEKDVRAIAPRGSGQNEFVTQNDERLGGCRLTIDGVRVALEICLDHIQGGGRAPALQGSTQILLIPSYGMEIGDGLYCVPGGVAFNVDGRGEGSTEVKIKGEVASKMLETRTLSKVQGRAQATTIAYTDPIALP